MTLKGWVFLILFVLSLLWFITHFPELFRRYYCPIASVFLICGGAYSAWTGRLVDEFGYEIRGRLARVIGIVGIALGLLIFQHCPKDLDQQQPHVNLLRLSLIYSGRGFREEFVQADLVACQLRCNGAPLFSELGRIIPAGWN